MHRSILLGLLLLGGCNSSYDISTNLDPAPIKAYFAVAKVTLHHSMPSDASPVGFVEGQSCQVDASQAPADLARARTQLRQAAANLGANGVVLSQCVELGAQPSCLSSVLCTGQAVQLPQ
ncbi:Rcs stress response system protein RcsF [uncultured Ferrimonas sp.]|uniref:Rcs stress response system protein RcsF n=1 Tax=uncultured Ferrimonas sp. TaxID=432640 RepID=UPI0026347B06|nr:Rcs stress response system protein RcsF [uncultured Ferrimonas sp.]